MTEGRRITFRHAKEEVDRLAKGLIRLGVKKDDNIAAHNPKVLTSNDLRATHPEGPRSKSWPRYQQNQGVSRNG